MGASACSAQNDMRPRGYLQCAVTVGGADGYRAWTEACNLDTRTLESSRERGQRAPSAARQPTDAMKRNVIGWPEQVEAWDVHQLTGCCDSSEAQDCSCLMTLTPRLAGRAGLVVSRHPRGKTSSATRRGSDMYMHGLGGGREMTDREREGRVICDGKIRNSVGAGQGSSLMASPATRGKMELELL